jgi:hypothetical protein
MEAVMGVSAMKQLTAHMRAIAAAVPLGAIADEAGSRLRWIA